MRHRVSPPLTNCSGCVPAPTEVVCDGQDNNCDGCIDNIATAPTGLCSTTGACAGLTVPILCKGASGWKCNYAGLPNLDTDGSGNLATIETKCDGLDNNCNGFCDENFHHRADRPGARVFEEPQPRRDRMQRGARPVSAQRHLLLRDGRRHLSGERRRSGVQHHRPI